MPDRSPAHIRAVVVEPRRLVREGLCALLARHPDLRVSGAAGPDDAEGADVLVVGDGVGSRAAPLGTAVVRVDESDVERLAEAVVAATRGPVTQRPMADRSTQPALTSREQSVLHLVGRGHSAVEIGRELGISPRTVERHKQSLVAKLGAPNQANAVVRSLGRGPLRETG